jgi:hypothetical protein
MSSSFNIHEILTSLRNTYSSKDTNVRLQSEQKLAKLKDENIVTFSSKLIEILKSNSDEIDKDLKLSIVLLLKRSIKEKIEKEELDINSYNQLIQLYITIMVNPNISTKNLKILYEAFLILLNKTSGEILLEIIKYIKKEIPSMPLGSVNGVNYILLAIIMSQNLNKKFFLIGLESILTIGESMIQSLYGEYEKLNVETNMNDYFEFNNIFMNAYELFFQCNFKASKRFKIKDEKISNIFNNIFIIGAKILVNVKAKDNNRIISWSGNEKIDKNINSLKIVIFRFLNLQVNDFGPIIIDKNKAEMHDQLIKIILSNLEWIIMNKYTYLIKMDSENEVENYYDYNYSLLISYMFIYLRRIFYKDNFILEYTIHFNNMYKNILLPLLVITNIEEEIAIDNDTVNGYCIDINDIIYTNKEKKIKSSLAGFMKTFYENNLSSNSFIIKYTIGLLNYLINNNILKDEEKMFDQNDIIILLLKAYDKEKIICALFLALNILSKVKSKNNNQNYLFIKDFYEKSFDFLRNNINYPCLKHQIILFIRNYLIEFYEPDTNIFESNLHYLFNALFETKHLLISNTAADSLQYFFEVKRDESENIKLSLLKVATINIQNFNEHIKNTKISNFFDVLYQIMFNFDKKDSEFFIQIFINVCNRVHVEVERHIRLKFKIKKEKNKTKKKASEQTNNLNDYHIIINKCFNIIRMLMDCDKFVIINTQKIEESLTPLVMYMNEPKNIDFDEDIINVIYLLIKYNQKVTPLALSLIKNLYKYCDKVGGLLLDLYMLVNVYLAYGTEQILSNSEWFEGILAVFYSGIKGHKFNKSPFFTCILIQTWLVNCNKISTNNVTEIINLIITKIMNISQKYKNTKSIGDELYNFLGYVTLILCGLINYSSIVISELNRINNANSLFDWLSIIKKNNDRGFEYEIKIIIYSICTTIKKGIINIDRNLLDICIDLLKKQEENANYEAKKLGMKAIKTEFIEDDDEESEQDEGGEDLEEEQMGYREIKDLIKNSINPIKDIDEFMMFKELLLFLKDNKNEVFFAWENSLNKNRKEQVYKLFGTKRISIQTNNTTIQVPRRIVTIKRFLNNNNNTQ